MRVDALQKYRNQLLSAFNAEQLQYLKYDNWSGLLTETDRLYATMFHDWDVLQKDSSDLAEAVQTLEWSVAPYVKDGEKPDAKAQDVAKTVTDALWKRTPHAPGTYSHSFPQLINALVHALFRGYNVHEIEWVNADGLVYPAAFHQLPPQFMRWEDRAGQVDRLLFIPDGETDAPRPFPKNKYLVALNTSGPDHPLFNAMYYSLIAWYGAYKFGLGWFMEYCQKYGMPKLVFHYESESDRRQLEKDLAEERVLNNILLKGDRAVDIANAPASGASLPQRELLNLAESQCHKLILGQTLTSDTSQHGGSLAQAKVHAGVQAEVVKKRADFVADVLNSQLIPAIVLLNYGTLDVPMPELRYKIPQEGVTLERVQVVKTALEIRGMKLKKSEVYEFTGFAQPADGDEVFEAASAEGDMAGFAGLLGKGKPQDDTDPDNDPNKPKKNAAVKESEDVEPVSAANAEDDSRRLSEPIPQPDGTKCYTENCQRHGTGSESEVSVEHARSVWKQRADGQETNPIIEIKGVPVNVAVSSGIVDRSAHGALREEFYRAYKDIHGSGYEESRVAWEEKALSVLKTKLSKQKFAEVEAHIKSGRNKMPEIKEAIKNGIIPRPPERSQYKQVPQLSDADINEMLKRRHAYFDRRKAEVLQLIENELGVEKVDESRKSASTYFYTRDGKKIRLSDHYDHVYNSALEKNISFEDSDDDIRRKLRALRSDNVQSAKTDAPTDPAQEWLAPIKAKFLEARKAGASMADIRKMLLTMHPNTKALAKAFANNILAGFAGESEEVDAANPWGCNQYGHRKGHKGGESKKKESDDVYDFDNMEPDERLQKAIDDLGEAEEEDIDWDDYDKAQEVKKIFDPDNHKVPQWRKDRMIQEVGNRVTDALRHLANVNKARRDFRNPNRPTEDDVNHAEEAFGKAVHEWRRFHRARLEVQGWDKKAIDGYLSRWPEYMETAKPTGCNQYKHQPDCDQLGDANIGKTKSYTEDSKKHEDNTRQTINNNVEYAHDDNSRTGGRSEKERSGGAVQRAGQARSHSEQGGDKEDGRQLGRRVLLPESVKRSVQKSLRALGIEDEDAEKRLALTTTAQVQSVLDGRKPAFLEPFQELVEDVYSTLPHDENIRYVAGKVEYCMYNADSVRNVLSSSASGAELDSIVKGLIDDSKSGVILGYGYNFLDNPRGWNVSITANGEEISGFDAPPDITESEYYASERTEDFRRAFPDMEWTFRIKE